MLAYTCHTLIDNDFPQCWSRPVIEAISLWKNQKSQFRLTQQHCLHDIFSASLSALWFFFSLPFIQRSKFKAISNDIILHEQWNILYFGSRASRNSHASYVFHITHRLTTIIIYFFQDVFNFSWCESMMPVDFLSNGFGTVIPKGNSIQLHFWSI